MPNLQLIYELEGLRESLNSALERLDKLTHALTASDEVIDVVYAYICATPISPRTLEMRFSDAVSKKACRIATQELLRTGKIELNNEMRLRKVEDGGV